MRVQVTFGAPDTGIVPIYVDGKRLLSSVWQNDDRCGWYTSDEASLGDATGEEWKSLEEAMEEIEKALQTHRPVDFAPKSENK